MLSHIVIFWLKPELEPSQIIAFREGLDSLKDIPGTRGIYIGTPAKISPRPVIDSSYSIAMTILFDSLSDQDAYQIHPLHQAFLNRFKSDWSKVIVYDYM
jgi:hypothetical protein